MVYLDDMLAAKEAVVADVRLNIGSGRDYREGWVNVDKYYPRADLSFDLESYPWPLADNSVFEANAAHVLEHMHEWSDVLRELHRVCSDGAAVHIRVPNFASSIAFTDPTHRRFFSVRSFDYFDPSTKIGKGSGYEVFGNFKVMKRYIRFPWWFFWMNPIVNCCFLMQKFYEDSTLRGLFPCGEMLFELVAVKKGDEVYV